MRPHRLAGPGHRAFNAVTRVRIPLGTPIKINHLQSLPQSDRHYWGRCGDVNPQKRYPIPLQHRKDIDCSSEHILHSSADPCDRESLILCKYLSPTLPTNFAGLRTRLSEAVFSAQTAPHLWEVAHNAVGDTL